MNIQHLIQALPVVAASWQALVGYIVVAVGCVIVSLKVTRNKNLLNRLEKLPKEQRATVLQMEMGASYLATGLSPEQWLQQQRQRYYFVGFLIVAILSMGLVGGAMLKPAIDDGEPRKRAAARGIATQLVESAHTNNYELAYDLAPDDFKHDVTFVQFKNDMIRTMFQVPVLRAKSTFEEVREQNNLLYYVFLTEFGEDVRTRDFVGFTKKSGEWAVQAYNWQPVEWPLTWPGSTVMVPSAEAAVKSYASLTASEKAGLLPNSFKGNITGSQPGWRLVVNAVDGAAEDLKCDVRAREFQSSVAVTLKQVIGGCKLTAGQRIVVNALLSGVSESEVQLTGVRYFPEK